MDKNFYKLANVSTIFVEKKTRNYIQYFLTLVLFTFSAC